MQILKFALYLFILCAVDRSSFCSRSRTVKIGMTHEKVSVILGAPGKRESFAALPDSQKVYRWKEGKSWIAITFVDNKVGSITSSNDLATQKQREVFERFKNK